MHGNHKCTPLISRKLVEEPEKVVSSFPPHATLGAFPRIILNTITLRPLIALGWLTDEGHKPIKN